MNSKILQTVGESAKILQVFSEKYLGLPSYVPFELTLPNRVYYFRSTFGQIRISVLYLESALFGFPIVPPGTRLPSYPRLKPIPTEVLADEDYYKSQKRALALWARSLPDPMGDLEGSPISWSVYRRQQDELDQQQQNQADRDEYGGKSAGT
mgnify:CR=1 FL=1